MQIWVDGTEVPSQLIRKPFSSLFRYRFRCDGQLLEVRVEPDGMRSFSVELKEADAPVAAPRIRTMHILLGCGCGTASLALVARIFGFLPWSAGGVIALMTTIVTSLLLLLVTLRRAT